MTGIERQMTWLNDRRFADHALDPSPVWLWSADAQRILWANPTAAAIFDAPSATALAQRVFITTHPGAAQIARLAGTLPAGGAQRLERLRGFGAGIGGTLVCLCSRIVLADNSNAVLVIATERAGKDLSLPERARRLLADMANIDLAMPAAIFTADGELIEATAPARERLAGKHDLIELGADKLAREASLNGGGEGDIDVGRVALLRLGAGPTVALLVTFVSAPAASHASARANDAAAAIAASAVSHRGVPDARRVPYRFVWQMDAETHMTGGIENFATVVGPETASVLNRSWAEVADTLKLDTDGAVARALASRDTWSGLVVLFPVDGVDGRVAVEMSGLPMFDRDRQFSGYRGFGVCREPAMAATASSPPVVPAPVNANNPAPDNVLAFRAPPAPEPEPAPVAAPTLSPGEHSAFEELARELNARLKGAPGKRAAAEDADDFGGEAFAAPTPPPEAPKVARTVVAESTTPDGRPILDRLPIGILVYRLSNLIYANRAFLDWTGYESLHLLTEAGGLDALFIEPGKTDDAKDGSKEAGKTLTIATVNGKQKPVEGRLFSVPWTSESALVLMINTQGVSDERITSTEDALRRTSDENYELRAILDTATDGVLVLDRAGRVLSANRSAQALFGYDAADFTELSFGELFAPESRRFALDYLERLASGGGDRLLDAGRETIGRVRQGGLVPLYVTMGRIEDGDKFCAVLRDITAWKRTEEELINARQQAERASTAKSEFLAKISHEIRTPLNAIIGFSEVMMDERFGAIGNERYKQYLKDIHASGGHLISLLNDLLDLSKIEAGKLDLTFVSVNLNDIVQQCVAMMQQQANRERVIIRTSLPLNLPPIVADARSVRQIALNLLSNSIKFTGAGGQMIVSTALNDDNEAVLRVRDTGVGMSENELQTALEPFRQLATSSRWGSSGTGLGLPITKALAEANHARFRITSQPDDGTLVEVAFPATRVLAE
ncbi:MAG: histidine kinase dimerization/phospho-acceptor domain-containing protein [Pseudolabrys sp.]|nr:histidine kinase dimerization/phospho-acceptor domain-containing protein [Pseudolabrys sp.]MDP2294458.1 histidine kinase dimerization/phospho-acceptor domain-containing protein [Pseudolabrys sp.]